jgi:hypothetical protein
MSPLESRDILAAQAAPVPPWEGRELDKPWDTLGGPDPGTAYDPGMSTSSSRRFDGIPASSDGAVPLGGANWWQQAIHSGTGEAVRWVAALGLVVWRWLAGPPANLGGWLPVLILAVFLLLPDVRSVEFRGLKLEMRQAREDIAGLRQQITQLQVTQAGAVGAVFGDDAVRALGGVLARRISQDEASGVAPRQPTHPSPRDVVELPGSRVPSSGECASGESKADTRRALDDSGQ